MDWNFGEMSLFYFGSFLEILVHFSLFAGSPGQIYTQQRNSAQA
jgi:hypothetical protein